MPSPSVSEAPETVVNLHARGCGEPVPREVFGARRDRGRVGRPVRQDAVGANVAVAPADVTVPATGLPEESTSVNVALVREVPAIASLKVAVTAVFAGTPVWLSAGLVELTVGGVVSAAAPVVKVQT